MVGAYKLSIKNKNVSFDLTLERQITIVRGDTATGKSYFADLVALYVREKGSRRRTVKVISDFNNIAVVTDYKTVNSVLENISEGLIIMDEEVVSELQYKLSEIILGSNNYFLLITRLSLENIPYSMWEIYEFNSSIAVENGRSFTKTVSFRQYSASESMLFTPDKLLVEDSGTGFAFFSKSLPNVTVESANGNSSVHTILKQWSRENSGKNLGVIVDSAAYGAFIFRLVSVIKVDNNKNNIVVFTPESFEWLVLNMKVLLKYCSFLDQPYLYCDTVKYHSWEVFFEKMLVKILKDRYNLEYAKGKNSISGSCMSFLLGGKKDILSILGIKDAK